MDHEEKKPLLPLKSQLKKATAGLTMASLGVVAPHLPCTPIFPLDFYGCPPPTWHQPHIHGEDAPFSGTSVDRILTSTATGSSSIALPSWLKR